MVIVFLAEYLYVFIWTKKRTIVKDITILNDTDIKISKVNLFVCWSNIKCIIRT